MIELFPGIVKFNNLIPDIDLFISKVNSLENWIKDSSDHEDARHTDIIDFSKSSDTLILDLKESLNKYILQALDEYSKFYGTVYENISDMTLLRYGSGQKYNNHIDDHPQLPRRRISVLFYINDNYSGGEIEFPRFEIKIKPEKNSLLAFPSTYVYNHTVHPVTEGNRYCLVFWLS